MSGCEYYQELISRMIDSDLTVAETAALTGHLAGCPECEALYGAFSQLSELIGGDLEEPPEVLRNNIMAELRREDIRRKNIRIQKKYAVRIIAAAACLTLIMLSAFELPQLFTRRDNTAVFTEKSEHSALFSAAENSSTADIAGKTTRFAGFTNIFNGVEETEAQPIENSEMYSEVSELSEPEDVYVYADCVEVCVDGAIFVKAKEEDSKQYPNGDALQQADTADAPDMQASPKDHDRRDVAASNSMISSEKTKADHSALSADGTVRVDMTKGASWGRLKLLLDGVPCEQTTVSESDEKYCIALTVDGKYCEVHVFVKDDAVFYKADIPGESGTLCKAACCLKDFLDFINT